MAKYNNAKQKDVNEPGPLPEERPYYDDKAEKEELEKVPVEYLGFITKKREVRLERTVFWVLAIIIVLGFGPGTKAKVFNPRTGEWRHHLTFAWGFLDYSGVPHETPYTEWYYTKMSEPHTPHWVPFGKKFPALFGTLTIPVGKGIEWTVPENLPTRMAELDDRLRGGRVMDIPRVLEAVSYYREWNAIILPLTLGSVDDAVTWWNRHKNTLMEWSDEEFGTPIPESYLVAAEQQIVNLQSPDGNIIPLTN